MTAPRGFMEMPDAVTLRAVREADRDFLFQVYAGTRAEELSVVPWSPAEKESFLRQQFTAQHRHYQSVYPDGRFEIIRAGTEDIGRLYTWRGPDEMRIIDIALLPAWCGRGIGGRLMRELLAEAGASGRRVTIHVELNNRRAQRLYERLGFKPVSEQGIHRLMEWKAPP